MACPRCNSPVMLGGGMVNTQGGLDGSKPGLLGSLAGSKNPPLSHHLYILCSVFLKSYFLSGTQNGKPDYEIKKFWCEMQCFAYDLVSMIW